MISGESTSLGLLLLSLGPLVGIAVCGIEKGVWCLERIMRCGLPVGLYNNFLTFHPG